MDDDRNDSLSDPNGSSERFRVIVAIHGHTDPVLPFVHALSLACLAKGNLEIVDVRADRTKGAEIGVRRTFEQWRMLPAGSDRGDVEKMGLRVKKIYREGHARAELARRLDRHLNDLLVIGTEAKTGIGHLFGLDLAEHLANSRRQTTLYVPAHCKPFVDPDTGEVTLRKIVVPVAENPSSEHSFAMVQRLRSFMPGTDMEVVGIHAGGMFPSVSASSLENLTYREKTIEPAEESLAHALAIAAGEENADLIVMSTNGRDTISQKIMGSVTEQVLKQAPCPVLAVAVE